MPENVRDSQVPDFVQEAEAQMAKEAQAPKREEVTIKFGKGLAEPFQSKDGWEFMRIMIPNQDQSDKTPWASFVLPAKAVHENQYGKGLWAKIPAEGTTVVTKPVLKGQDEQGKDNKLSIMLSQEGSSYPQDSLMRCCPETIREVKTQIS